MPTYDYDVIVAGGGIAGLVTATAVAHTAKQRYRVAVLDRNPEPDAGKKTSQGWVCGDAVGKDAIDRLQSALGTTYGKPELEYLAQGVRLYSPDRSTRIPFEGPVYALNRRLLPQRLVRDARREGVEFLFSTSCDHLVLEGGGVRSVICHGPSDPTGGRRLSARVVVDATGQGSSLRLDLPSGARCERRIEPDDLVLTGRRILQFKPGVEDPTWFDATHAIIHLTQHAAPGGYAWVFPKAATKANIGVGVQKRRLDSRNQRTGRRDGLDDLVEQYVRENQALRQPVESTDEADRGNTRGTWQVSVRRPNDCLVANGYAMVGDAAWMARPIDAVGISPAIRAGLILGETISGALEANDPSEAGLWPYTVRYMQEYGHRMLAFELLRRYLQTLPDAEINYGLKHFVSEDDVAALTRRENPSFGRARSRGGPGLWLRALRHARLARNLMLVAEEGLKLARLGSEFPERPSGFDVWRNRLHAELERTFGRFAT